MTLPWIEELLNSHFDIYSELFLHMNNTDLNLSIHSKITDFNEILEISVDNQKGKGAQH